MSEEEIEKYKKEYENMSLCDLADEFVTPLFDVKGKEKLLEIIYINYAYNRDKAEQLETTLNEVRKECEINIRMFDSGKSYSIAIKDVSKDILEILDKVCDSNE